MIKTQNLDKGQAMTQEIAVYSYRVDKHGKRIANGVKPIMKTNTSPFKLKKNLGSPLKRKDSNGSISTMETSSCLSITSQKKNKKMFSPSRSPMSRNTGLPTSTTGTSLKQSRPPMFSHISSNQISQKSFFATPSMTPRSEKEQQAKAYQRTKYTGAKTSRKSISPSRFQNERSNEKLREPSLVANASQGGKTILACNVLSG